MKLDYMKYLFKFLVTILIVSCTTNESSSDCPDTDFPVCGDDGLTYKNACGQEKLKLRITQLDNVINFIIKLPSKWEGNLKVFEFGKSSYFFDWYL